MAREVPRREVPVMIVVRKKKAHHASHGGAWKVAFADFMTAMFALFLVLWLINQSSDIKSAIAGYFQDPLGRANEFGSSILPGEGAQASVSRPLRQLEVVDLRRDRLAQFAEYLRQQLDDVPDLAKVRDKVEIEITRDGLRIQLLEDSAGVFFETGRAAPSMRGQEILALLGRELGHLPNRVLIEGYTDARPYAPSAHYGNWELSVDRANTARRILTGSGLAASQIWQVRGYADRNLRDPQDPLAARNRRVAITLLFADPAADSTGAGGDLQASGSEEAAGVSPDEAAGANHHEATGSEAAAGADAAGRLDDAATTPERRAGAVPSPAAGPRPSKGAP